MWRYGHRINYDNVPVGWKALLISQNVWISTKRIPPSRHIYRGLSYNTFFKNMVLYSFFLRKKSWGNILHSYLPLPLFIQVSNKSYKISWKIVLAFLSSFGAELVYTILLNILRCEQIISLTVLIRKQQSSFMLLRPNIEMAAEPQPDLKLSVDLDSSLWVAAEG